MPEQPPAKRAAPLAAPLVQRIQPSGVRYAELHVKTNFSFLTGASHPDEFVARAAELGYTALAITDRESLAGVVRAHAAAKAVELPLLIGAELHPQQAPPVVVLATDRAAYGRLARLLSVGRRRAPKGECLLDVDDLAAHSAGLLALICGNQAGGQPTLHELARYREIFADRCYVLAELHRGPDDRQTLADLMALARRARVPLVAANDVHYHVAARRALADVLLATRLGCTVVEAGPRLSANAERHLKAPLEMADLFAEAPGAIARTIEIAARCTFNLDQLRYEYPEELSPPGRTPLVYLAELTWAGARERYPAGIPPKVRKLIEHELRLIEELRYEAYFLTVWDLMRFAREREILCQGRGSAANSAVCYCLGVTSVNPDCIDLLFERFISRERNEAPDIDLDFEHERREEVLQYIYDKYGRDRAGMTAEIISYRPRSAVRDVGKALGFSLDRIDALAKTLDGHHGEDRWEARFDDAGIDHQTMVGRQWRLLVTQLIGFPRHLSQHVGGMVITRGPLCEMVPIENAAMPGRTVIQWDKDDLDELGILKVDCLALGMLTAIRKCFDLIQRSTGRSLTLATVPVEDAEVYEMICQADTIGVFQIESRAQMTMLPRLRPREFYDLVIEVAIVRPGPIQGNMVHPYLRRRAGLETVTYPNDEIQDVLAKTMGVPIFQEQAMRLAVVAAGFTPGEADQLRRAMGAWRRPGLIEQFHQKLIEGMLARGLSEEFATNVFRQIRGFGEYGFPESHAASFALLVYVSAWLKHYYPAAFAASLVNSQPMGFYAPAQLVRDAREHGVAVRPVDVNCSGWDCTLEINEHAPDREAAVAIRLGMRMLAGLPSSAAERIVSARGTTPYRSLADLARRAALSRPLLTHLVNADALQSLAVDRRTGLWQALAEDPRRRALPLFDAAPGDTATDDTAIEPPAPLPPLTEYEQVLADYRTAGLSLRAHPMAFFRATLTPLRILPAQALAQTRNGRQVRVAGLVLVRQRPSTARGITFVTLEDETGVANLVIRPDVWQRFRTAAKQAAALMAQGRLERKENVVHILVNRLVDLRELSADISSQSRDFR